jgi:hypothetical protein
LIPRSKYDHLRTSTDCHSEKLRGKLLGKFSRAQFSSANPKFRQPLEDA